MASLRSVHHILARSVAIADPTVRLRKYAQQHKRPGLIPAVAASTEVEESLTDLKLMLDYSPSLVKGLEHFHGVFGRTGTHKPNNRHGWLLRPRHERPRRRAAECRDERASSHEPPTFRSRKTAA
jgi:hypothetical protein